MPPCDYAAVCATTKAYLDSIEIDKEVVERGTFRLGAGVYIVNSKNKCFGKVISISQKKSFIYQIFMYLHQKHAFLFDEVFFGSEEAV